MCQEEGGESERLSFGWWSGSQEVGRSRMREGMLVVSCGSSLVLTGGHPSQWTTLWEVVRKGADASNSHNSDGACFCKVTDEEVEKRRGGSDSSGWQGCPRVLAPCVAAVSLTRRWPGWKLPFRRRHYHSSAFSVPCAVAAPQNGSRQAPRDVKKSGCVVRVGHCNHPAVNRTRCSGRPLFTRYGRLYCEFVMKKLCSFVGALQVVCLPVLRDCLPADCGTAAD